MAVVTVTEDFELRVALRRALRDGTTPNVAIEAVVFGGESPPRMWGEWSKGQREVFSRGVEVYREEQEALCEGLVTLETSWTLVRALAPDPGEWWMLPRVTWSDFALASGMGARQVHYRYETLGWCMTGRYATRRVLRAPCLMCGRSRLVHEVESCCH